MAEPVYHIAINDALRVISERQGELDEVSDCPLAGRALDELENVYQKIAKLPDARALPSMFAKPEGGHVLDDDPPYPPDETEGAG